jgi:hypothetical protein
MMNPMIPPRAAKPSTASRLRVQNSATLTNIIDTQSRRPHHVDDQRRKDEFLSGCRWIPFLMEL